MSNVQLKATITNLASVAAIGLAWTTWQGTKVLDLSGRENAETCEIPEHRHE